MSAPAHDPDPEDVEVDGEEDAPVPTLEAVRARHPSAGRSRTIPARKLTTAEKHRAWKDRAQWSPSGPRPATRGDCESGGMNAARPCPWVACSAHLYLDVSEDSGALKLNFPDLEVWEMPFSCALDEAEASSGEGMTLEQVAARTNLTRERVRQVEERIHARARDAAWEIETGSPRPSGRGSSA